MKSCEGRPDVGRTTLQKLAYLSTAAMGWPQVGHRAYHYGPFSRRLEREAARMVSDGLVDEGWDRLGFIGTGGFEGRRYSYALTESGRQRADDIARQHPVDATEVQ